MKPLSEARSEVLAAINPIPSREIDLAEAMGRVLAEKVVATESVPPFDNSAMDGYAVRGEDVTTAPTELRVVGDVRAGHTTDRRLGRGEAIRIMTGAPIPEGADTVVRVEDTDRGGETVTITVPVDMGRAVRHAGGDVRPGDVLVDTGTILGPRHVAVMAAGGRARPRVHDLPRVAILSTGDEVRPPDTARLAPGEIRDANRPLLVGLLGEIVDVVDLGIVADDRQLIETTLAKAAEEADAIVTSGGVSVGTHDLLKEVLVDLGDMELWRVAMQPAKPFAFGHIGATPVFGLPGNPVSVFVAFEQFVRPALLRMQGVDAVLRPRINGVMDETVDTDPEKDVFLRVVTRWVDGKCHAVTSGAQGSNMLAATAAGDAFAVVPVGVAELTEGSQVELEMFTWPAGRTP